jgi:hypothetical protein
MVEASESLRTGLGLLKLVSDWEVYTKINMQRKRIELGIICLHFFRYFRESSFGKYPPEFVSMIIKFGGMVKLTKEKKFLRWFLGCNSQVSWRPE